MLDSKTGVGVRLQSLYHLFIENHCFSHSASLTCKGACNKIDFMGVFQNITFELLNLIKLSSKNEHVLEEHKKTAQPCKLNPVPSKVGCARTWNPTRFTENFNTLNSVKLN